MGTRAQLFLRISGATPCHQSSYKPADPLRQRSARSYSENRFQEYATSLATFPEGTKKPIPAVNDFLAWVLSKVQGARNGLPKPRH